MSSPAAIIPYNETSTGPYTGTAYATPASQVIFHISSHRPLTSWGEVPTNRNLNFTLHTDEYGGSPPQEPPKLAADTSAEPICLAGSTNPPPVTADGLFRELVYQLRRELAARNHALHRDLSMVYTANIAELRQELCIEIDHKVAGVMNVISNSTTSATRSMKGVARVPD